MRAAFAGWMVLAAIACSSYGETNSNAPPPVGPSDSGASDSDATTGGGDADASATFCQKNVSLKLCDDFEDGVVLDPPWNRLNAGGASRDAATIEKVDGNALLRVAVPAGTAGSHAWCMLEHEISPVPAKMTFAVTAKTAGFVDGDYVEVATVYEKASSRAVALFFDSGRMYFAGSGAPATDVGDATVASRYVVTMEGTKFTVRDAMGALRADVMITGPAYSSAVVLGVGLTYSDKTSAGTIEVDDVTLDY